jgi:hypothetical protein
MIFPTKLLMFMPDPLKNGKQNVGAWPYFLQMGIITHKDKVIE